MKILITGTSQGIGKTITELFLQKGHTVIGIDRQPPAIKHSDYIHYQCDVRDRDYLPVIEEIDILINNAGTQNEDDIDINLKLLIWITVHYGIRPNIKFILNVGSASAHTGSEFSEYCASKGGVIAYTKFLRMLIVFGIDIVITKHFETFLWYMNDKSFDKVHSRNTFRTFITKEV